MSNQEVRVVRVGSFGEALRLLREEQGYSYRDVANNVGCDKADVPRWEKGEASPSGEQLAKLFMTFRRLRYYAGVFNGKRLLSVDNSKTVSVEATPDPSIAVDKIELPPPPKTFGEALKRLRIREGWEISDVAELAGVEPKDIHRWEIDKSRPSAEHLEKVCGIFDWPPGSDGPEPDGQLPVEPFAEPRTVATISSEETGETIVKVTEHGKVVAVGGSDMANVAATVAQAGVKYAASLAHETALRGKFKKIRSDAVERIAKIKQEVDETRLAFWEAAMASLEAQRALFIASGVPSEETTSLQKAISDCKTKIEASRRVMREKVTAKVFNWSDE